jgi:hypothetical protein
MQDPMIQCNRREVNMMKRMTTTVAAMLLAAVTGMNAAPLVCCHSGSCITNKPWYSVSSYDGGRLVHLRGHDATGSDYELEAGARTVAADPTSGETPVFSGVAADGGRWFVVIRYDARRRVIWEGGRDAGGAYWEWTLSPSRGGSETGDPALR